MHRRLLPVSVFFGVLVATAAYAAPVPISTCGQTVLEGVLAVDLDCSGVPGFAVILEEGGTLDLAGHQLIGGADDSPEPSGGVHCLGACTVNGSGGAVVAPAPLPAGNPTSFGIYAHQYRTGHNVRIDGVTITGWQACGAVARRIDASNCRFVGNNYGLVAERSWNLSGCVVEGNFLGANALDGTMTNSTFTGNHYGVLLIRRGKLESSSVSNQNGYGVVAVTKLRAINSVFDQNCLAGESNCADVTSDSRPRLVDTPCDRSLHRLTGETWGVCSAD